MTRGVDGNKASSAALQVSYPCATSDDGFSELSVIGTVSSLERFIRGRLEQGLYPDFRRRFLQLSRNQIYLWELHSGRLNGNFAC
jgi:hypothetical protein